MQPDLDNIKKKIEENRDLIDRITLKLPGFEGYVEKSEMYGADKIVRDFIADRIQGFKGEMDSISSDMYKGGKSELLPEIESLNMLLEKVMNKCRYADYGSAVSTTNIKVTEEDMNRLLEYDWRMLNSLDDFDSLISSLADFEGDDFNKIQKDIKTKIKNFEKGFDDRKHVILEVI